MDFLDMQRVVKFILQTNIEEVREIYKEQVDSETLSMLQEKADKGVELRKDNSSAWFYFINQLNAENSQILADYIDLKEEFVTVESFMF